MSENTIERPSNYILGTTLIELKIFLQIRLALTL